MPTKKPALKKPKNSKPPVLRKPSPAITSLDVKAQLNEWAHEGSKESMDKIIDFIKQEKDEKLRGYANCALEEAEYFYYSPWSPKEEKEFLLAKMISEAERRFWKAMMKADNARLELDRLEIDKKVHEKIMNSKNPNKREDWQYNFSEDFRTMVKSRLDELDDEIFYTSAWIEEARKLITIDKYKNIPDYVMGRIHLDAEAESFWPDDYDDDKGDEPSDRDEGSCDNYDYGYHPEVPIEEINFDDMPMKGKANAKQDNDLEEVPF